MRTRNRRASHPAGTSTPGILHVESDRRGRTISFTFVHHESER